MKLNLLFSITAVYMGLLGLGFIFAPREIGIGAVPADAPATLIDYLRVFGSTFLGYCSSKLDGSKRGAFYGTSGDYPR